MEHNNRLSENEDNDISLNNLNQNISRNEVAESNAQPQHTASILKNATGNKSVRFDQADAKIKRPVGRPKGSGLKQQSYTSSKSVTPTPPPSQAYTDQLLKDVEEMKRYIMKHKIKKYVKRYMKERHIDENTNLKTTSSHQSLNEKDCASGSYNESIQDQSGEEEDVENEYGIEDGENSIEDSNKGKNDYGNQLNNLKVLSQPYNKRRRRC